jgi:malate dehydrogenase (oxaloacetate-decarboxylating)(NADP+)
MVLAGLINALSIKNKKLSEVKIVINGAGAAGISTFKLLVSAGANKDSCFICDTAGLIYSGRT